MNLLVIEDDPGLLGLVELILGQAGHTVSSCQTAAEALDLLAGQEFHALIVDLVLPEIDGTTFIGQVRRMTLRRQPAIIVCSGRATRDSHEAALAAGADRFLAKPFRRNELYALLEELAPSQ